MGKNLKGKELGTGISQRKDGRYTARYTNNLGERVQKYFDKLQDCRNWIADTQFNDEHGSILNGENMTVDSWFEYWINLKKDTIRINTLKNYQNRYKFNIKPYIGRMLLSEVKPLHCQNVLNQMANKYTNSSILQTRVTMHTLFEDAVDNEIISRNPVKKNVACNLGKESKAKRVLSLEEQKKFIKVAADSCYYNQYSFVLQTGLRVGELVGLKWSDIDFDNNIIHIKRTMEYKPDEKKWLIGNPKSRSSCRDIPLTDEAINILKSQREKNNKIKVIQMDFADFIFLSKKGEPVRNYSYDSMLFKVADKAGIERLSMHSLRHTFATRCIEGGMKPKILQGILGHSSLGVTMDIYVHITDEEKQKEIANIQSILKVV